MNMNALGLVAAAGIATAGGGAHAKWVRPEIGCGGDRVAPHPVAMGAYTMDSHHVRRVVTKEGDVQNEGDVEDYHRYSKWGADAAKRKDAIGWLHARCRGRILRPRIRPFHPCGLCTHPSQ